MKNLRKYDSSTHDLVVRDYQYSFLGHSRLARIHNIPTGTIEKWTRSKKRMISTPDLRMGRLMERMVNGTLNLFMHEYTTDEIDVAIDKYFGKNGNNFVGLKSKV